MNDKTLIPGGQESGSLEEASPFNNLATRLRTLSARLARTSSRDAAREALERCFGFSMTLTWLDSRGPNVREVDRSVSFGRASAGNPVDIQVQPPPGSSHTQVVSRHALDFHWLPEMGQVRMWNRGRVTLAVRTGTMNVSLEPGQALILPESGDVRWPGTQGEDGFHLGYSLLGIGSLTLRRGEVAQRVALFAPITRVLALSRFFEVDAWEMEVDLGTLEEGVVPLRPRPGLEVAWAGERAADGRLLWHARDGAFEVAGIRVELSVPTP